eukprot:scaffold54130_cov51-Phaeocystis_antarctica.AAC.1
MRTLGVPLEPQGYSDLLGLAAQGGVGKLLAFQPPDLLHPLPCHPYHTPYTPLSAAPSYPAAPPYQVRSSHCARPT